MIINKNDLIPIDNLKVKGVHGSAGWMSLTEMMHKYNEEERIETFFRFLKAYDERKDSILAENPHIFSHRLHWHENDFYFERIKEKTFEEALEITFIYSFSGENNNLLNFMLENGLEKTRNFIRNTSNKVQRGDLYQMWLPKGKHILRYILTEIAPKVRKDLINKIVSRKSIFDIMEFTEEIKKSIQYYLPSYKRPKYPSKNMARHIAMSFNTIINPSTFVRPGTGSYRGFQQIFGGKNLIMKDDRLIKKQFEKLIRADKNCLITRHKYINFEDKVCFFFKYLTIASGWIDPHNCPDSDKLSIILPDGFSLYKPKHFFRNTRTQFFAEDFIDIIRDLGDGVSHKHIREEALRRKFRFINDDNYNYKESWKILREMAQAGIITKVHRKYYLKGETE